MSCWSSELSCKRLYRICLCAVLAFIYFAFSCPAVSAQGNGVEVLTGGPRFLETMPGRTVTVSFLVTNRTQSSLELVEKLEIPPQWQRIIPLSSFRLPANGSTTRVLAFHIPASAPSREYEITYTVRDQDRYSIQDGERVRVKVLPVEDIALMLEDKPFNVIAGNPYEVKVRLFNGGNSDNDFSIKITSKSGSLVSFAPSEVSLKAGESKLITINVKPPVEMETTREYLRIEAYSRGKSGEIVEPLSVGIDVIGQIDIKADPYHFIPTTLSIFMGGDSGDDGDEDFYLEWRGFGSIDEEGTKFVDFMFRGPDTSGGGYFTERDEYYFNYYEPLFDVLLGDQSYNLSRLTSNFSYGRGFGVNYRPGDGDLEVGGHYVEDRDDSSEEETGFHASYRVNNDLDLRLNYLDKREVERSRHVKDEIWSLEADYGLGKYGQLLVEYGISDSTRPRSERDDAYLIEYDNTLFDNVSLYLNRIHAGIDYEGYYNGYDYTSAFVGFPLSSNLRMGLSYTDYEDLIDPDETSTSFYAETSWRAYLDYTMGRGWYANLGYEHFDRADQLLPRDSDYTEDAIWLRVGRSLPLWSYMVEARTGEREDHLTNDTTRGWNYRIYITHRPSDSLFFTLFSDFGDDQASDIRGLRTSSRLGFSVSWQIRQNWLVNMWYSKTGIDSDTADEDDEYEIRTFYTLRNGHSLELALRHDVRENSEDETECLLTYNIPIKIKTERRKNLGTIEGRIYDAQAEGNPGLEGVIVKSQGRSTVTDGDGLFILSPLVPGEHVLEIDRQSIGWDRVPKIKSPIVNDIKGMGETTHVDIGITDSCAIAGKVVAVAQDKKGEDSHDGAFEGEFSVVGRMNVEEYSEPTALSNILVEIKAGDHVIRKLTDRDGEFRFVDIYPDNWILTVYDKSLPAYTYIENPQVNLALEPGEELMVTKRVLPKVRRIEMLVQGEKITSEKVTVSN